MYNSDMKTVAVLRGGPSQEYGVSMKTGQAVLDALGQKNYKTKDIVVAKNGDWLNNGFVKQCDSMLEGVDAVFVGLHGQYGEDGNVQKILQRLNIPFTGSRSMSSAIAFNKELTKRTLGSSELRMPRHRKFQRYELVDLEEQIPVIFSDIGSEVFVKPVACGSSYGARYVPNEETLRSTLNQILEVYDQVLIEEYIRGREATVGVMSNFRNESLYALPVIEIIPPNGRPDFNTEDKYSGEAEGIVPGRFSYSEKAKLAEAALLAHKTLACDHYSRSDFIVKDGEVYFLEINTLPGLTAQSLFPKAASAVGLEFADLVAHLAETAR